MIYRSLGINRKTLLSPVSHKQVKLNGIQLRDFKPKIYSSKRVMINWTTYSMENFNKDLGFLYKYSKELSNSTNNNNH